MKTLYHRSILWLSQYQLTLIIIAVLSLSIGVLCLFWLTGSVSRPEDWLSSAKTALHHTRKEWVGMLFTLVAIVTVAIHYLFLGWVRTARNRQNLPLIISISLLALWLTTGVVNLFFFKEYEQDTPVEETQYFLLSKHHSELVVVQSKLDSETLGIYSYPFHKLQPNRPLKHKDWDFSITPTFIAPTASIGGNGSRMFDKNNREIRGLTATKGVAQTEGIRLFPTHRKTAAGKGLVATINDTNSILENSYLLYAATETAANSIPLQRLEGRRSHVSIALLKKRHYPNFSWQVTRDNAQQSLVIYDSTGKQKIGKFPLGLNAPVYYKGYGFKVVPPSLDHLSTNHLKIYTTYSPAKPLLIFLTTATALSALIFLGVRSLFVLKKASSERFAP